MKNYIYAIGIAIIGLMIISSQNVNSMNKCQEFHSFDTCFSTLNK